MMKVSVQIRGADRINQLLKALPKEVVSNKRGGVVAQSMRKGARVLIAEEKKTLQKAIEVGSVYSTGQLIKKLTVKRKKYAGKGEKFQITIRSGTYKVRADGRARVGKSDLSFYAAGLMLEYGSSKQGATPWVRPAFLAKSGDAFDTITGDLLARLDVLAAKYLPREL